MEINFWVYDIYNVLVIYAFYMIDNNDWFYECNDFNDDIICDYLRY